MKHTQLKKIIEKFQISSKFVMYKELVSGHINQTYFMITNKKPYYVLQQINHKVFKDVPRLIKNKVLVTNHLSKFSAYTSLTFVKTNNNNYYHLDTDGSYWNLMIYVEDSVTFNVVPNNEVAFESGKIFGDFLNATANFDASTLASTIPDFHNMKFRFHQFDEALALASEERKELAKNEIEMIFTLKQEMLILQKLREEGKIKTRVTHNDTKISNALFTKKNKGLCVIDLDTVMPGIIHYDFGDAVRTICTTAKEDETDLEKIQFSLSYFEAFTKGFLLELKESITPFEASYLPLSAKTITFIMGLRMLTDFLNNDVYYKIAYPQHNLDRAKNQLYLIQKMELVFDKMKYIVSKYVD